MPNTGTVGACRIKPAVRRWRRLIILMAPTLALAGCFDPAKDTCNANDVITKMTNLVTHSFVFLAVQGIEVGTNGFKGQDGQPTIRYRERFGEIRTEGYDAKARIASCTGVFHFDVAPRGNDQLPEEQWSKHDLAARYRVKLTDKNEFLIDNNDWDWQ